MGSSSEVKRNLISRCCCLDSGTCALIVAWSQIVWYAVKLGALQQWAARTLDSEFDLFGSLSMNSSEPADEQLLKFALSFHLIVFITISVVGLVMAGVLLLGVTRKHGGCLLAWLVYSGAFVISNFILQVIHYSVDQPFTQVPCLFLTTCFHLMGIYVVRSFITELSLQKSEQDDKKPFIIDA